MRPPLSRRRLIPVLGAVGALTASALAVASPAQAAAPPTEDWKLLYAEDFTDRLKEQDVSWVRDPHGDKSPWNVDHLDDDGKYFQVQDAEDFPAQLNSFDLLRKRVPIGKDGWLTAELAARDMNKDGTPESPPTLTNSRGGALLNEPSHDGGIILRNSKPLPSRYRVEATLRTIDFGGKRNGSWNYDGKQNGYAPEGCKTNWPWKQSGDFAGEPGPCHPGFGDVRNANGYYFLAIMDYAKPAPHNNIFIHNHRKVGMDGYNTHAPWASAYKVCNPKTGELYPYLGEQSGGNAINEIFFDGSRWRNAAIGYNEFVMPTECGVLDGGDPATPIGSAAELQPELMPKETYKFAIERNADGYTMEMSGDFKHAGEMTLRYHRKFVEDGRPIWHYNQTPEEYDGSFNQTLTFSGPDGSYEVDQWPAGSAYPDSFILGDPHINFYEGSATVDDIKLYVPRA